MTHSPRRHVFLSVSFLFVLSLAQILGIFTPSTVKASSPSVYWGAYIKGNTYGYGDAPWDTRTIETFESHAGKKQSILHWGSPWYWGSKGYMPFQRDMAEKVRLRGSIPMITWTSEDLSIGATKDQSNFQLGDIIYGKHDTYIRQWARDAKAWGYPMFVRMNHEMNGTWYHWSEKRNGNSAGQYARMWQHVVGIFKAEGATNVTWVWAPNRLWHSSQPLKEIYPGSSYVDWVGMSGYNWGTNPAKPNNSWQNFDEVFKPTYDQLGTLASGKPIMVTETASTEHGGSKASWIKDVLQTKLPTNYPRIKALVWFNWNHPATYGNMDWVIESSSSGQGAFKTGITTSYYAANTFGSLPKLSKVQPLGGTTSTTTAPTTTNTIVNPSFESTGSTPWHTSWATRNDLGATFTQDGTSYADGSKSMKVSLSKASSTQPWVVQVRQDGKALTAGKTYTVSFYAKASSTRSIDVLLQKSASPYTEYFKRSQALTTSWAKYSYTYTASTSDSAVKIAFNVAQATGQVWIDNVSLVQH